MVQTTIPCVEIPLLGDAPSVRLIGGIELQSFSLLDLVQPAIAPLMPLITAVEAVLAVYNVIKTIPGAILSLSPSEILDAIKDAAAKVLALVSLVPQLSLPFMLIDVLDLIIDVLDQVTQQLNRLQSELDRIDLARERADELGDPALLLGVISCAEGNVSFELANTMSSIQSLGKLFAVLQLMLDILQINRQLPDLDSLGATSVDEALDVVSTLRDDLQAIRDVIQIP